MAKKIKKNQAVQKSANSLKEDIQFFKSSMMFLLLCGVILFTLRLADFGKAFYMMTASWLPFAYDHIQMKFIFGVLTVAAAAFFVVRRVKKTDESMKYLSSLNLLCISGFCLLYCFVYGLDQSVTKLIVLTVICGVLYYIKKFFNCDFVLFYIFNVMLCFDLWCFFAPGVSSKPVLMLLLKIFGVLATLAVLGYAIYTKTKGDKKAKFIIWPYAVSGVLAVVLATICLTASVLTSTYAVVVMLIQFIVMGVYYTVKVLI